MAATRTLFSVLFRVVLCLPVALDPGDATACLVAKRRDKSGSVNSEYFETETEHAPVSSTTNGAGLALLSFRRRTLKAKFHYAIWTQTCPKLVADLQRAGTWPII